MSPDLGAVNYPKIDYQDYYYYSAPKRTCVEVALDEVDPEILRTYEKLGIPLREQEILGRRGTRAMARARVWQWTQLFDPVSAATTFKERTEKAGVIFMLIRRRSASIPNW